MKNLDCNQIRSFKTSQDYSKLSFPELLVELYRACNDLKEYRVKMVRECNELRKEHSSRFGKNWGDLC